MLGKIGNVTVGAGYQVNDENHKIIYPQDRLTKFLRVDATNAEAIQAYCHQYSLVPRDLTNGWQDGFIKEQQPIKLIAKHIVDKKITNDDLTKINQEIEGISTRLMFIDKDAMHLINDTLSDMEFGEGTYPSLTNNGENQVVSTKQHPNTIAALYEELAKFILRKRLLKECRNCGQFFITTKKTPTKQFCSDECRDKYHKKEAYHSKK